MAINTNIRKHPRSPSREPHHQMKFSTELIGGWSGLARLTHRT